MEAYIFTENPDTLLIYDFVCSGSLCTGDTTGKDIGGMGIIYGEMITTDESGMGLEIDAIEPGTPPDTFYTITVVYPSVTLYKLVLGDGGENDSAVINEENSITGIGSNPEYFYKD
ncbi:MAG: hypothetical protein ACLFQK_07220 [Fibrobacterota bacterium]